MLFTNPIPSWFVVPMLVYNGIKDEEEDKGGVVGNNSLCAGELSIIDHIKPGGKQKNSWNAVKHGFQQ